MEILIGFVSGFMLAWLVRCQEWQRGKWFIWIPKVTRNHHGQRFVIFGFWWKWIK